MSNRSSEKFVYAAHQRFSPADGGRWTTYLRLSGLVHLRELVTLDKSPVISPLAFDSVIDEDWRHNVAEDYRTFFFRDLDHLLARVGNIEGVNILAAIENPAPEDVRLSPGSGFAFQGYDLVDARFNDTSALASCLGFDRAFRASDLNAVGLIDSLDRAAQIQQALRREYAGVDHADCSIWAVWRLEQPAR
jgi:hypothetical protein